MGGTVEWHIAWPSHPLLLMAVHVSAVNYIQTKGSGTETQVGVTGQSRGEGLFSSPAPALFGLFY